MGRTLLTEEPEQEMLFRKRDYDYFELLVIIQDGDGI
jgi:hypothetical protein